jgi:hypothetical protein
MYTGQNLFQNETPYGFGFNLYGQDFTFVPKSYLEKGFVSEGKQYLPIGVLNPEFDQDIAPYSRTFSVDEVAKAAQNQRFQKVYEKSGFSDKEGYLLPNNIAQKHLTQIFSYDVNEKTPEGFVYGTATGLTTTPEGQKYFNVAASGKEGATAYVSPDGELRGNYVIPGDKKKWYETPLGIAGIGLLGLGGLGLAGIGPLASGGAAAGSAAGIVGTPGVSTIFPVAAPIAPTVTAISPMTAAGAAGGFGLLEGAAFPSQGLSIPAINSAEVALLPQGTAVAGQGLQVPTLPGLSAMGGGTGLAVGVPGGTVTQLGMVPTGATPVLGDPKSFINNPDVLGKTVFSTDYLAAPGAAASGISASDALRLANQARGLLGAGQNPIVPQQQGLPQGGGGAQGVDYSGLLSLLQMQAKTPGVSSLTAPAQLRQMYQPTLLPNVLSLLG